MAPKKLPPSTRQRRIAKLAGDNGGSFTVQAKLYNTKLTSRELTAGIEALDYVISFMKFLKVNHLRFTGADISLSEAYDTRMKLFEVRGLMRD